MNKNLKLILTMILSLSMMASLTACKGKTDVTDKEPLPVAETPAEEETTITLIDDLSREVTFEAYPERLVSGYYITTSMLMALGLTDQLVGIEAKAKDRPIYALAAPKLLDLPNVGSAKEFNLEGAISLSPDLLVLPVRLKEVIGTLEEMEMNALGVNPESYEDMARVLRLLGKAADKEEKAEEILAYNDGLLQKAEEIHSSSSDDRPVIYFAGNSSLLTTAGGKMFQSDLLSKAGAENAAKELTDSYWAEVSYEQILVWDPDYILLSSDAGYSISDVLGDPALSELRAVKEKKVFQLPSQLEAWDSPVPASVLGVMAIVSELYPDRYPEEDYQKDVITYYERFYGFTADLN
jgi:iron complex transport system substrate-binding protein